MTASTSASNALYYLGLSKAWIIVFSLTGLVKMQHLGRHPVGGLAHAAKLYQDEQSALTSVLAWVAMRKDQVCCTDGACIVVTHA